MDVAGVAQFGTAAVFGADGADGRYGVLEGIRIGCGEPDAAGGGQALVGDAGGAVSQDDDPLAHSLFGTDHGVGDAAAEGDEDGQRHGSPHDAEDGNPDAASFLATAMALENTGVRAYDGAAKYIENPDLLTAAGTIVAVEARHASYLNLINGEVPFPSGFEEPATMEEILEIAGPFFSS